MKKITALPAYFLKTVYAIDGLQFTTTADIENFVDNIGQQRAIEAIDFGISIKKRLYHLYALGPAGLGKHYFLRHYLNHFATQSPNLFDWCYVNNFKDPQKPIALKFLPGHGEIFKSQMNNLVEQLQYLIPAIFESKEYRSRIQKIESKYKTKEDRIIKKIHEEAKQNHLMIVTTPSGYEIVPLLNDEKMTKEQIATLSEIEQKDIQVKINKIAVRLNKIKDEMPQWYKQMHEKIKEVKNDFCNMLISSIIGEFKEKYDDPKVLQYLRDVQQDIIDFPQNILHNTSSSNDPTIVTNEKWDHSRYEVNLIVSNENAAKAPIIYERNPNYSNLVGQLEGTPHHGTLTSDFTWIKPGALHKANGGYLLLEISKVLKDEQAWEALKRILLSEKITIEPLQPHGIMGSTQLQPEPIPLETKVILLGNRTVYELLGIEDDDFSKLFKVLIDFETTLDLNNDNIKEFVFYIAKIIKKKGAPFHREAIEQLIEHCIRLTGDSRKITLNRSEIIEIVEESQFWANRENQQIVRRKDVIKAINAKIYRFDKIREHFYENIESKDILIDLQGEAVGQINGVSIIELPYFNFGLPTRITATTRSGNEAVIDIQKEVSLGGSNHSKGILILAGYLKGHYAKETPYYLSASVVLEQTYGGVDGDSASLAELCALISSLSNVPVKQAIAVTGSVNQHGIAQSVGGINVKIEGFYDLCLKQGLTGEQGVIIPTSNVKNLMLKDEIIQDCSKGRFHIYEVKTVDDTLRILTAKDPEEIHRLCEETLVRYATGRKFFSL